jgi:hypothetical protein
MKMVADAQRMAENINVGIYGDGGCCGCTEKKRRTFYITIGVLFLIAAVVCYFVQGQTAQAQSNAIGCVGGGVIFLLGGICCPNGCCNEYSNNNGNYQRS